MKDGISCDEQDQSNPLQPEPYFAKNKIFGTDYLCRMSPRPEGRGGCTRCNGVGCCNQRGTFGARIASTECITLRWLSDSSLACRLAPGIGSGLDVMVAIGSNFFYTVTLPCSLWFFDKGKPAKRKDKVLFINARHIFRQVTRSVRDFNSEQLNFIANIVRLYRGDAGDNTYLNNHPDESNIY